MSEEVKIKVPLERISLYLKGFVLVLMGVSTALLIFFILFSFQALVQDIAYAQSDSVKAIIETTAIIQDGEAFVQNLVIILLLLAISITGTLFFIINYYLKKIRQQQEETLTKTEELYFKSRHNHLTDLPSMSVLNENLTHSENYSVIMLDIDNIAIFNTTYGNELVDIFIKEAALYLQRNLPSNGSLYHLRADEFVIILNKPVHNQSNDLAKQIKSYFENTPLDANGISTHLNFSFGIAKFTEDTNFNTFTKANIALVEAKRKGRNLIVEFDASMSEYSSYTQIAHKIETLQRYIEEDGLIPFYQPIVDTKTQEIVKYEVLVRIQDGNRILLPSEFLQAAELTGLLTAITKQIIQKSFIYFSGTDINFSINITKNDFLEKNLINFLRQKCQIHNIKPQQVTLEILENIALGESAKDIIEQISALAADGYVIAIDDFGVESSNISRLSDLNANFIKIDGSFIKDLDTNEKNRKIVESLVYMAKKLEIQVIAEFVHNKAVYEVVKELGIDYCQGYYFSEPTIGIER
ncbi:MAG: bifunctional diguanylate cyclase/phosphodiesterase [Sulfurimonas sp.]|nr:bifunctional diguanylate cyclase/phosphodiesterase [Sulfurimonas sp.]